MTNEMSPRGDLRVLRSPEVRGWTVVGADGRKIGRVIEVLADPDEERTRFLHVELDQTTLEQSLTPGGEARVTAGRYPADPNRPGSRPQADVDPSVGESERTASFNTGSRQHAPNFTGAVPRGDDGRLGGSGREAHPRVLIPLRAARLKEADEQIVLETLRAADLAELPAYSPVV
ncbi:MAG: PRC-barrel domain-containing protein [Thermoanaerobaculia bacterium]